MPKNKEKPWQYTFTTILAGVTLLLVIGYFMQSFIEISKVKPVTVAMERIPPFSGAIRSVYCHRSYSQMDDMNHDEVHTEELNHA